MWNIPTKKSGSSTGYWMMYFLGTYYSIIPVFQHSNWGEAPKFGQNNLKESGLV